VAKENGVKHSNKNEYNMIYNKALLQQVHAIILQVALEIHQHILYHHQPVSTNAIQFRFIIIIDMLATIGRTLVATGPPVPASTSTRRHCDCIGSNNNTFSSSNTSISIALHGPRRLILFRLIAVHGLFDALGKRGRYKLCFLGKVVLILARPQHGRFHVINRSIFPDLHFLLSLPYRIFYRS
jgi:hypothetical protein